jgi:hypothetical protein
VEGHSLVGMSSSVGKKTVEVHGASPDIRWVSDEVIPGYHKSVRVDNELYQVSVLSGSLCICSPDRRSGMLFLLSLMEIMIELGPPQLVRI